MRDVTLIVDPYTHASGGQVQPVMRARADSAVNDSYAYVVLENDAS